MGHTNMKLRFDRQGFMKALAAALAACVGPFVYASSSFAAQPPVRIGGDPAAGAAVASDDQAATDAAWAILESGGTAVDAAIAGALTLSVTMPHAASLAGGGAAMRYDAKARQVVAYIGRERTPAAVNPDWLKPRDGKPAQALIGGQSFGAPSLLSMLEKLHDDGGTLPWLKLTERAERLARVGAPLNAAAAKALKRIYLVRRGRAEEIFLDAAGSPQPEGAVIRNRELAAVLAAIGRDGPDVLSGGVAGNAIIRAISQSRTDPLPVTLDDLEQSVAVVTAPACVALSRAALCGPPAPTLAPAALQASALFDRTTKGAASAFDWTNRMAQAHRLAMTDARRYLTDPDHFPDLYPALLEPRRLDRRARRISASRNPGRPGASRLSEAPRGLTTPRDRRMNPPTASIVVVDQAGHAVALSITLSYPYGAGIAARGVILNAANSGFDAPHVRQGFLVANSMKPGKRPALFAAPVMALDQDRRLVLAATASGLNAPAYLAKAVSATLLYGKSAEGALRAPNIASATRLTELEERTPAERLANQLDDIGHRSRVRKRKSNLLLISRRPDGSGDFDAAADRRNAGTARTRDRSRKWRKQPDERG
jgi:gamma-glutamyltranspeptidase/glutathione hydrolase